MAPVFPKSDNDRNAILTLLKDIYLTKSLDSKDHVTLAEAMQMQHYKRGDMLTRFGDIGDKYYILAKGIITVKVYEPGTSPFTPKLESHLIIEKELSSEPTMVGFGEIALLLNSKRTASVIATSSTCSAWVLSADVFKHIIAQNTLRRRNINLNYLDQVSLFKGLETYEKLKLIDGL